MKCATLVSFKLKLLFVIKELKATVRIGKTESVEGRIQIIGSGLLRIVDNKNLL